MRNATSSLSRWAAALGVTLFAGLGALSGCADSGDPSTDSQIDGIGSDEQDLEGSEARRPRPSVGRVCGGLRGQGCGEGQYCDFPASAQCGAADQTGVCKAKPEACTEQYDPVCGCDGKTYGNACAAASAGVSVAKDGECSTRPPQAGTGETCGGIAGIACKEGLFCNYAPEAQCGAGDQTGKCEVPPQACTREYRPVCGCDGKTYGNACTARAAGVSIASEGECKAKPEPKLCGSRGLPQCAADEFCSFPAEAQCGATDKPGTCTKKPEACTLQYDPVCGCDGQTYGNACEAASKGASVAKKGACESKPEPRACGGLRGLQCNKGEYCNYAPDAMCGRADATGTCTAAPQVCTKEYAPVCGCNGVTYGNACEAASQGVSVEFKGECKKPEPRACGGLLGLQCQKGEFCNFSLEAQCGAADQTGTCQRLPEACTADINPVCGCDGKTYSNACGANVAGVSVAKRGACEAKLNNCDQRDVVCKRAPPKCPGGTVPSVVNGCYGDCVEIEQCACREAAECFDAGQYACWTSAGHCGDYVR